jgi:hypothetical protein
MGWWGCGIMQGDPPLDILADLRDELVIGDFHPCDFPEDEGLHRRFLKALPAFLPRLPNFIAAQCKEDAVLAAQVVGVCLMAAGADIDFRGKDGTFREYLVEATRAVAEDATGRNADGWKRSFKAFARAVESYDGTPAYLGGEGLFDTMAEKMLSSQEVGKP